MIKCEMYLLAVRRTVPIPVCVFRCGRQQQNVEQLILGIVKELTKRLCANVF